MANAPGEPDRLDAAIDAEVRRRSAGDPAPDFARRVAARVRTSAATRHTPVFVVGALAAIALLILATALPRHPDPPSAHTGAVATARPPASSSAPAPAPSVEASPGAPKPAPVRSAPGAATRPRPAAARVVRAAAVADPPEGPVLELVVPPLESIAPIGVAEVALAPVVSDPLAIDPVVVEPIRIPSIASGPF